MRFLALFVCVVALVHAKVKRTIMPTLYPVVAPPTRMPVFRHTAAEYLYYSDLYKQRADFIYKFFPHSGPAFYAAQTDQARANRYAALAKDVAEAE